jgi:hypothetical protein
MLTYDATCASVTQHRRRLEADATRLRRQPPPALLRPRRRRTA